jgi:hypothetical protein
MDLVLKIVLENRLTLFGIIALIAVAAAKLTGMLKVTRRDLPALFTTIGICFTFIGVALGLIGFNGAGSIGDSVSQVTQLLVELRSAFIVSAVGVGFAVLVKIYDAIRPEQGRDTPVGSTIDDIVIELRNGNKQALDSHTKVQAALELVGTTLGSKIDNLVLQHAEFARTMADNNSQALIEALEDVMRDFNTKINEQFGDNFRQLNEAVGQLVLWQSEYKTQLEKLIATEVQSANSIANVSAQFAETTKRTESFVETMSRQASLSRDLQQTLTVMQESLVHIKNLVGSTEKALPAFDTHVKTLLEQVGRSMVQNGDNLNQAIVTASATSQDAIVAMAKQHSDSVKMLNEQIQSIVQESTRQVNNQIQLLDTALQRELTSSLTSFSQQMAALSAKFAEDYTPITESLQRLLASLKR